MGPDTKYRLVSMDEIPTNDLRHLVSSPSSGMSDLLDRIERGKKIPDGLAILVYNGDDPIGWAVVSSPRVARRFVNLAVFVLPEFRMYGIGTNLVREVVTQARRRWPSKRVYAYPNDMGSAKFFKKFLNVTII